MTVTTLLPYITRWHELADRLIATRYLEPPEMIELSSIGMLIALAQKMGDCDPNVIDSNKLDQAKRALIEMRDDVKAGRKHEVRTWN